MNNREEKPPKTHFGKLHLPSSKATIYCSSEKNVLVTSWVGGKRHFTYKDTEDKVPLLFFDVSLLILQNTVFPLISAPDAY